MNLSIATGKLAPRREANPHYHERSDEIYVVLAGSGAVRLGEETFPLRKGDQVFIPKGKVHSLDNPSAEALEIMCIAVPAFEGSDFIMAGK